MERLQPELSAEEQRKIDQEYEDVFFGIATPRVAKLEEAVQPASTHQLSERIIRAHQESYDEVFNG